MTTFPSFLLSAVEARFFSPPPKLVSSSSLLLSAVGSHFLSEVGEMANVEEELHDWISELPNNLLGYMLTLMPTKDAVATSTLSKRWRYVWACSPIMNLDISDIPKEMRGRKMAFIKFVENAMLHFNAEKLKKFRLCLDGYEGLPKPSYDDWISFAVQKGAEEIEFCLPKGKDAKIPECLFTYSSLKSLYLRMKLNLRSAWSPSGSTSNSDVLPSPAKLTMLEKLHLSSVPLPRGHFLGELFANCLQLKEVILDECKIDGVLDVNSDSLQKLKIKDCDWVHPVCVRLAAPALRSFCYSGTAADEHIFEGLESLVEVELDLNSPSELFTSDEQSKQLVMGLFEEIGNVHTLKLSSWCIENLCRVENLQGRIYNNIKCLALTIMRKQRVIRLAPLIASCSYLTHLKVAVEPSDNLGMNNNCEEGAGGGRWRLTPLKTDLKHLISVELVLIDENKTAKELISYILETARLLQRMTIIPSKDGLDLQKFKEVISKIRARASNAIVEYCIEAGKKRKRGD